MAQALNARIRRHILDVEFALPLDGPPVTVLFGPSGSGKTTLLRCLAGLDRPEPGSRISLDAEEWDGPDVHVRPARRHVGYLFQDHALFPHMSVDANVAYGLHRLRRPERRDRVHEVLRLVEASHLAGRTVRGLSGGEAQRVALARALAPQPRLLLLDEPLSALDEPTRVRLRAELRHLLLRAAVPAIVVTHDRTEALALGDRALILIAGRLRQFGAIESAFSRPADHEVASAVGVETVLPGHVEELRDGVATVDVGNGRRLFAVTVEGNARIGDDVLACIRAEDVAVELPGVVHEASPRNHLSATVVEVVADGPLLRVTLDCEFRLAAYVTRPTLEQLRLERGSTVIAAIKATAVHLIHRGTS